MAKSKKPKLLHVNTLKEAQKLLADLNSAADQVYANAEALMYQLCDLGDDIADDIATLTSKETK